MLKALAKLASRSAQLRKIASEDFGLPSHIHEKFVHPKTRLLHTTHKPTGSSVPLVMYNGNPHIGWEEGGKHYLYPISSEVAKKITAQSAKRQGMKKEAVLGAIKGIGGVIARNPGKSLAVGLTAATAPAAVKGEYQKNMTGFNPDVQRAMQGQAPTPPGAQ